MVNSRQFHNLQSKQDLTMLDKLLVEVSRRIEHYCIDKAWIELPEEEPSVMPHLLAEFGMASYLANECGCTHYVVAAPDGHAIGFWFSQLRCRMLEMYASTGFAPVSPNMECLVGRRVTIVADASIDAESLLRVTQAIMQHKPAEIWLYLGGSADSRTLKAMPPDIAQVVTTNQIYNKVSHEQLEKDFIAFFGELVSSSARAITSLFEMKVPENNDYAIGRTLKPLMGRLQMVYQQASATKELLVRKYVPKIAGVNAAVSLADNQTFEYFKSNLFLPGNFSLVSVQPCLGIPFSLMLVLKFARACTRYDIRMKPLVIALADPSDLAERLVAYCMGRNLADIMKGRVENQDWSKLARACGEVHDLGIDFWQQGVYFEADQLKSILRRPGRSCGLIVIYDAPGQLPDYISNMTEPEDRLTQLRALASELCIPVVIVSTSLMITQASTEIFHHAALLNGDTDQCELMMDLLGENRQSLYFRLSRIHNILEDDLVNFTSDRPANYEPAERH